MLPLIDHSIFEFEDEWREDMPSGNRILIVEDTLSLALLYQRQLEADGYGVRLVDNGFDALTIIRQDKPDLILLDLGLPDMAGGEIQERLLDQDDPPPVIVITADGSLDSAVTSMRLGALDYLVKPFSEARLAVTVRNALERQSLKADMKSLEAAIPKANFSGFVGSSPAMQAVYAMVKNVASSKASVFITGESGTGKEVTAQAIHDASLGKKAPFIAINCGAIPDNLIESELFGHRKGAFTGAISDRLGAARAAHGGTLFLDEICEMRLDLQTKLLRFLQTRQVQPVGTEKTEAVDVRVICATNRDPFIEVQEGRFREDLYYRLNVIPIDLPPLRARGGDIMELAEHFLKLYGQEEAKDFRGFSPDARTKLTARQWPGNVRELQNVVRQIAVMTPEGVVEAEHIPTELRLPHQAADTPHAGAPVDHQTVQGPAATTDNALLSSNGGWPADYQTASLDVLERRIIEDRISLHSDSVPQAAKSLGVSPSTIYRKRETWVVGEPERDT